MNDSKEILKKRMDKLDKHFIAIREYAVLIDSVLKVKNIYNPEIFQSLKAEERAILEAYLKRFASIQDFLGSKIFPLLLEIRGIGTEKMSEVLDKIEKEGIIDSLSQWIELREIRNDLEHDYPDDLAEALADMRYCVEHVYTLESYYANSLRFIEGYLQ